MCLTHTDLKPENIMLVNAELTEVPTYSDAEIEEEPVRPKKQYFVILRLMFEEQPQSYRLSNARIQIIDFGSAHYDWQRHTHVVSTRHYRAPEVILSTSRLTMLGKGAFSLPCLCLHLCLIASLPEPMAFRCRMVPSL
jgi:serine/threonine protein kinase